MQKAFDYIEKYHMLEAGDKVVVGVSGGADSLCLLFVLLEYRSRLPFSLLAVHVEHGLRGEESRGDARFVEELCRSLGVEYRCISCDVAAMAAAERLTVEEAGRKARYEAFARVCRETGANKIAVAHTQNDQAETMLFQMARGSALKGAGGIRPVRGCIIRPLLSTSRGEIEEYLRAQGQNWRVDATNESRDYTRNCLRHDILPLLRKRVNPAAERHLAELGEELQKVQDYLEEAAERVAGEISTYGPGRIEVDAERLRSQPEVLRGYILRECMRLAGCPLKDVGRRHMEELQALFEKQSGRRADLPGGWQARRQFDQVVLQRAEDSEKREPFFAAVTRMGEYQTPDGTYIFHQFPYKNEIILQNRYTKWFDYDKIKKDLSIRTRRPGDYLVIGRDGGRKKLKEYLIGEKVPAGERERILLLAAGSEILWVIGYRISEAYKVTSETKTVLEIQKMGECYGGENRSIDTGGDSQ